VATNRLGRYQIVREIGRSNDIVYEAIDTSINRRVAVKELVLPPNLDGQQRRQRIERFYREARAAGTLTHPNIVTIYEAGEDHGRHFIAMEYLEGQSLRDVLEVRGQLTPDEVVDIAKQVCAALDYAHSHKVIHRDIKPDNIHILPGGHVKLTDFGIARLMEEPSLTAEGQVFGTPSYMSPEQVSGKPLDHRTDIFSLGIVIYEMLTGRKPFTGDSVVTITYNIMNQEVVVPPSVPPFLERVIHKCLAKDPNLRYNSAAELAADLEEKSYQPQQFQGDAYGATVGIPPGTWQGGNQPPAPTPGTTAYGTPPAGISIPQMPRKPLISAEAKYFLKVLFAVLFACAGVTAFVWAFLAAYQGFQRQSQQQEIQYHLDAGKRYADSQSYLAAIQEFSEVLKRTTDPRIRAAASRNIAICYVNLGVNAQKRGDLYRAITHYRQAIVYDKGYADAYVLLGTALLRTGREHEALAAFLEAIKVEPGSEAALAARQNAAVIYYNRGEAAYMSGEADRAIQYWRKAVEIAPGTNIAESAQARIDQLLGNG